jgi:hypothetical protein
MKKGYDEGGEIDAMEEANNRSEMTPRRVSLPPRGPREMGDASAAEEAGQFGDAGTSRVIKATPKAMPKATADSEITRMKNRAKSAEMPSGSPGRGKSAEMPADVTKMSLADRAKRSREMARSGSGTTDRRSVGERLKSAFGMKSGGSVSSASKRADGIATKGKTRGKMC